MTTLRQRIEQSNARHLRDTVNYLRQYLIQHHVRLFTAHDCVDQDFCSIEKTTRGYHLYLPDAHETTYRETFMIELARIVLHEESHDTRSHLGLFDKDSTVHQAITLAMEWMMPERAFRQSLERNQGLVSLIASEFGVSKKMVEQRQKNLEISLQNTVEFTP